MVVYFPAMLYCLCMIKGFVFDMDGVLLDTESVCDRTWEIAAKDFGVNPKNAMRIISLCRGTNKKTSREIILRELGSDFDVDSFMKSTSEYFKKIESEEGISTKPYAKECLAYLKEKGYRLALASSTRQVVVERELKTAGLYDFFETVVCGDMVTNSKPDPEIYATAVKNLSLLPSECVAVEDSPNGLKSGKGAGLVTVMVPDRVGPNEETEKITDHIFDSLKGVIDNF